MAKIKIEKKIFGKNEIGNTAEFGKIVAVWSDPKVCTTEWVLIKNDDKKAPKKSFSFYKYKSDVNGGSYFPFHFIPAEILENMTRFFIDCPELFKFEEKVEKEETVVIEEKVVTDNNAANIEEKIKLPEEPKKQTVQIKKTEPKPIIKEIVIPKKEEKQAVIKDAWPTTVEIKKKPFVDIFSLFPEKKD